MSRDDRFRASIIACARWESPSIVEWVAYHASLGFDHFYLYCNDDDPASFRAALSDLPPPIRSMTTCRPFAGQGRQAEMYVDGLRRARPTSDWICFLDIDEFIVLKRWRSIPALLDELDASAIDSIHLNWLMFGNNGHDVRPSGSVFNNYTKRSRYIDCHTKHISRSSCFEPQRMLNAALPFWHGLADPQWIGFDRRNALGEPVGPLLAEFPTAMARYCGDGATSHALVETAYVAHFVMKSKQDFLRRAERGTGGNFSGQIKWKMHADAGDSDRILQAMNEVEDFSLFGHARPGPDFAKAG